MHLDFVKLNGLGNDFIFIEDFENNIELNDTQVKQMCDRHFGIGADGVILVRSSKREECRAYMHYINSDGSLAQMCGNGVRCFAKYLVDRGYVDPHSGSFIADTLAGPRGITFETDKSDKLVTATVDMGKPIFDPAEIPVNAQTNATCEDGTPCVLDLPLRSAWGTFKFSCVSMGNPHAVCFIEDWEGLPDELFSDSQIKDLSNFNVNVVGAYFESYKIFPEKTNVEFAVVKDDAIQMRVFERGCGETLACGTGACATDVAASLTKRSGRENDLILRGGTLHIVWNQDDHVLMSGSAEQSFAGIVDIENM